MATIRTPMQCLANAPFDFAFIGSKLPKIQMHGPCQLLCPHRLTPQALVVDNGGLGAVNEPNTFDFV
jgi:hypothetical protein